jgi:phage baseplate assembly protein W
MRLMIDLRTGEPVLDLEGSLRDLNVDRAFYQLIDCLLRTQIGSEILNPGWGLDVRGIMSSSSHPNWESLIKFLTVSAVSPSVEPTVSSVENIELVRTTDGADLTIKLELKSKYGTTSQNLVGINE